MSKPPLPRTGFRVEVLDSVNALRAVAGDWDDLWQRSDVTMPTVSAEPTALWIERFGAEGGVHLLTVRQGNRLVGAMPLVRRRLGRVIPVGDLSLNHWSPNGELLLDEAADLAAIAERFAEAICSVPWPLLWFEMVPYHAKRWRSLAEALARRGVEVDGRPGFEIGRVSLQESFDVYLAGRSKNLQRSIRKDLKRLEGEGQVELRLLDHLEPEHVDGALRRAFALEDSGWKGQAGTSVLRNAGVLEFYRRQAEHFARHASLRLAFLECGGRAIAFEMGWFGKGVYHSFKAGYDEDYRKFGPGHLLRYLLIEAGCADPNLRFIDYQGPINRALASWATETYAIGRLAISPPRIVSKALWTGIKTVRRLSHALRGAAAWLG
jgi:CelD/BcsL family acetyltransferase involved in cellulose biosynthesis